MAECRWHEWVVQVRDGKTVYVCVNCKQEEPE